MNKKILLGVLIVALLGMWIVILADSSQKNGKIELQSPNDNKMNTILQYGSNVCVFKNGMEIGCKENVITTVGLNHVRNLVGAGVTSAAMDYVALGNGTTPVAGSTTLNLEITLCGLGRAQGTFMVNGDGNWTIQEVFTSSCDNRNVSTVGIFNASSVGSMFAGTNFANVTLNNLDQLTVNYTKWVA